MLGAGGVAVRRRGRQPAQLRHHVPRGRRRLHVRRARRGDVRRDDAGVKAVRRDTRACEPARELGTEHDVRELRHAVLLEGRRGDRRTADGVEIDALRSEVGLAGDGDDARTLTLSVATVVQWPSALLLH